MKERLNSSGKSMKVEVQSIHQIRNTELCFRSLAQHDGRHRVPCPRFAFGDSKSLSKKHKFTKVQSGIDLCVECSESNIRSNKLGYARTSKDIIRIPM